MGLSCGVFFRRTQGNALFLILIAVALFAALSYAVTQSGRGSGGILNEQNLIEGAQLTSFPAAVRSGVSRMIVTGTVVSNLNFDDIATGADAVFHPSGGGVIYQAPPAAAIAGGIDTNWHFKSAPTDNTGWFISGIGSDSATGKDAFAYLKVSLGHCAALNKSLGLTNATPLVQTPALDMASGGNDGKPNQTGGGSATDTGTAASAFAFQVYAADPQGPQAFACIRSGNTGRYVYYHAIVER